MEEASKIESTKKDEVLSVKQKIRSFLAGSTLLNFLLYIFDISWFYYKKKEFSGSIYNITC
jgi:hypothetical protein